MGEVRYEVDEIIKGFKREGWIMFNLCCLIFYDIIFYYFKILLKCVIW